MYGKFMKEYSFVSIFSHLGPYCSLFSLVICGIDYDLRRNIKRRETCRRKTNKLDLEISTPLSVTVGPKIF